MAGLFDLRTFVAQIKNSSMRSLMYNSRKMLLAALCCVLISSSARAAIFTAVLSGNFNAAATWGGIAPGSLLSSDIVIIPAGVNVTLTGAQTFSGTTALTVNGTLTSTSSSAPLIISAGNLYGSGSIMVDSASLNLVTGFTFNGSLHARKLTSMGVGIGTAADITVMDELNLAAGNMNVLAGSLTMGDNSDIIFSGGSLSASGTGMLMLDSTYNVWYNAATTTSTELSGSGLNDIYVNTMGTVMLGANTTVNGMLTLTSGMLSLNGRTLTIGTSGNVAASGTGTIMGSSTSNVVINSTTGLTGTLRFAAGGNTLNNLTINTGSTSSAALGSDLNLNGTLTLMAGSLNLNGYDLAINTAGNVSASGAGTIWGNTSSDITINATSGLTGGLRFASAASTIGNLTINTGSGNNVMLASNVTANGTVTLSSGNLVLNGNTLTIGASGNMAAAGTGSIMGSTTSNLVINSTTGLTGALRFAAGGNTLNNLTVNTGTGTNAMLGGNLNVNGMLTLTGGSLALNGNTLTFNASGNLSASGSGSIMGNSSSNVIINSTTGLAGQLRFATGGSILNNLTVNTGASSNVMLGSSLAINGMLTLSAGTFSLNGYDLTISTTGDLATTGTGSLAGNTGSDVVVNATAGLTGMLRFASTANTINSLTINTAAGNDVTLGSDVNVNGMLTLSNGTLMLNGNTLTINATGNLAATGTGNIMGSSTSNLVVNSTAGLTGVIRFAAGGNTLNNVTINTGGTGNAAIGSDLMLNGTLTLSAGSLSLNGYDLTFNTGSHLATTGTGTIWGNASSDVIINATAGLAGTLRFASAANTINNFTINTATASNVYLGSNVNVNGTLMLTNGTLMLNGNSLSLGTTGDFAASGTGTIMGSTTSNLAVNSTASLSGMLRFATAGNVLNNLTINTGSTTSTDLSTDMTLHGTLALTSGNLDLNGRTLTLAPTSNVAVAGTGRIMSNTMSNIVVNSTAGLSGSLRFAAGADTINNLTINTGSGTGVMLGSNLMVDGDLTLTSGSLNLNSYDLVFDAGSDLTASGTGTITGNTGSDIVVNATAGLTGNLRLASTASSIGNLTINSTTGGVYLGSNATVNGMLMLNSGTLSLNGNTLTFASTADYSATGSGAIMGSLSSDIIVNATAGLSALRFTSSGNMLENFTVNTGSTSDVTLSSDLQIGGTLTLSSGTLALNGNMLTINNTGNVAASGTGDIMGSSTSRVVVNSTSGLSGKLRFAPAGNTLQMLTVNTGATSNIALGSDLKISGSLKLQSGKLKLGTNNLRINTGAIIDGGSATSYILTDTSGSVTINLAAGTNDTFEVGTSLNYAPIIVYANSGSATGDVSIYVRDGVAVDGGIGTTLSASQKVVNATWFVTSTATTINYDMMAAWSTSMELNGFNRNQVYLSHYTDGMWDVQPSTVAGNLSGMHAVTRTGITSLSPFMVSDAERVTVNVPVVANQAQISVYPNPATNVLRFTSAATIEKACIYDASGKCVLTSAVANDEVNVSTLPAGMYVIHLSGKDLNVAKEFVKQ